MEEYSLSFLAKDRYLDARKVRWIREHVQRRECVQFVDLERLQMLRRFGTYPESINERDEQTAMCRCGRRRQEHLEQSSGRERARDYRLFSKEFPTDVFVQFVHSENRISEPISYSPKQMIRLAADTDLDVLRQLIGPIWDVPKSSFLVSVYGSCAGGASGSLFSNALNCLLRVLSNPGNALLTVSMTDPALYREAMEACDYIHPRVPAAEVTPVVFVPWSDLTDCEKQLLQNLTNRDGSTVDYKEVKDEIDAVSNVRKKAYFLLADYGVHADPRSRSSAVRSSSSALSSALATATHADVVTGGRRPGAPVGRRSTIAEEEKKEEKEEEEEEASPTVPGAAASSTAVSCLSVVPAVPAAKSGTVVSSAVRCHSFGRSDDAEAPALKFADNDDCYYYYDDDDDGDKVEEASSPLLSPSAVDERRDSEERRSEDKDEADSIYQNIYQLHSGSPNTGAGRQRYAEKHPAPEATNAHLSDTYSSKEEGSSRRTPSGQDIPEELASQAEARMRSRTKERALPGRERTTTTTTTTSAHGGRWGHRGGKAQDLKLFSYSFPHPLRGRMEALLNRHTYDSDGQGSLMILYGSTSFLDLAAAHKAIRSGIPVIFDQNGLEATALLLEVMKAMDQRDDESAADLVSENRRVVTNNKDLQKVIHLHKRKLTDIKILLAFTQEITVVLKIMIKKEP